MSLVRGLRECSDVHSSRPQTKPSIEEPIAHLERMVGDRGVDGYRPSIRLGVTIGHLLRGSRNGGLPLGAALFSFEGANLIAEFDACVRLDR
jgi:hypothetical protein